MIEATYIGEVAASGVPDANRCNRPAQSVGSITGLILRLLIFAGVVFACLLGGLWLRDKTWNWTADIRFSGDIDNAFRWGSEANDVGYFSIYERLGEPQRGRPKIDYAPLRLGVMSYWVAGLRASHLPGELDRRQPTLAFHRFLLNLNTIMEFATAVGVFLLVRHLTRWRRPARALSPSREPWRGTWLALLAAATAWFNPLVIYNAHAWPQWDIWPMPFFIIAIYCCIRRQWLIAGLLIGIGSTLKGQILLVAWVLPLFALFIGDWRGSLRIATGLVTGIMLIGLPWVVTRWDASNQTLRAFDLLDRKINWFAMVFITSQILIAAVVPVVLWRRFYPTWVAFAFASSAWLGMILFGGTTLWLQSSFGIGLSQYRRMYMGAVSNLSALLADVYGWTSLDDTVLTAFDADIPIRTVLIVIFFLLCVGCTMIAAVRFRQRDTRAVIALCLPWLLMYAILGQIHERYLLYISACVPIFLVCGGGWFLLGSVFTLLGFLSIVHVAIQSSGVPAMEWSQVPPLPWDRPPMAFWGFIRSVIEPTHPQIAWAMLLGVLICLGALMSRRRGDILDDPPDVPS